MPKPVIVGLTISVDLADKSYGAGSESFMSLQGKYPDPTMLEDVLVDGLDMYFAAWKSLLSGRYATGVLSGPDFKETLAKTEFKFNKVRNFLVSKEAASGE